MMFILITGGSGSGKSEFAENTALRLGGEKTYVATMKPYGNEAQKRIERHRTLRAGKGFKTVERYTDIKNLSVSGTVLVECISNLLANEMFSHNNGNGADEILSGADALRKKCENLIIVTNEVSSDGVNYSGETEEYKKNLGTINRSLAKTADEVYEVVCGRGVRIK